MKAITSRAPVSSGAFYAHFGSKGGAFDAALKTGLDEVIEGISQFRKEHGKNWVAAFAEYYLGRPHRNDLACGCAMTTLSPEIARADAQLHAIYEAKMKLIVGHIADGLAGGSEESRQTRAWAMLSTLIGGLTLARAVRSPTIADNIAKSVISTATHAAGKVADTPPLTKD